MEDDEEEQLPRCRETPVRNQSTENTDASRGQTRYGRFETRSTQTLNSARAGDMAPFQGSERDTTSHCGDAEARTAFRAHCGNGGFASLTAASEEPRALFHGNAGFRAHFPALFEPFPEGDPNSEERLTEERRPDDKDDEHEAGIGVEIQIGRKLREMGDRFQHEHLQQFTQHHRGQLGLFQLVTSLYNFLFPQERLQNAGAQR